MREVKSYSDPALFYSRSCSLNTGQPHLFPATALPTLSSLRVAKDPMKTLTDWSPLTLDREDERPHGLSSRIADLTAVHTFI